MLMKKSLIQSTEEAVQQVVAPVLFGKGNTDVSSVATIVGPLLRINIHILKKMHQLLTQKEQGSRSPTFLARYALWTHTWPDKLDHYYKSELIATAQIDRAWLTKEFDQWRNLWAGLQFAETEWKRVNSLERHPLLGYLSGQDWFLLVNIHSTHQAKRMNKYLQT
jgi:hypothetical protein